ncbi:hypothetical protein Tco_0980988 [Tanacetum coccineum]
MSGVPEARNKNKYCDFHEDKGHNTNDCLHLRMQIKEAVNLGQLAHLVKEIKKGNTKASTYKVLKKPDQAPKIKESPSSWSTPGKEFLKANLDVFAWKPVDMTCVRRTMAEHMLGVKEGTPPSGKRKEAWHQKGIRWRMNRTNQCRPTSRASKETEEILPSPSYRSNYRSSHKASLIKTGKLRCHTPPRRKREV